MVSALLVVLSVVAPVSASTESPVRKVINLLQNLHKEVEVEARTETEMFNKYMCYCDTNEKELNAGVVADTNHIEALEAKIEELTASNAQLTQDIGDLDEDLTENKEAVKEATAVRKKESEAYDVDLADLENSIDALSRAIPAIEEGQGQKSLAEITSGLAPRTVQTTRNQMLMRALLQETQGSTEPASSQILGILQQMKENFEEDLKNAKAAEAEAIATFESLELAKSQEIESATAQRDDKKARVADQKLTLASAQEDLEDTKESLANGQEFRLPAERKQPWMPEFRPNDEGIFLVQTNARKDGSFFRNMFYLKPVELNDRQYIVGLQTEIAGDDDKIIALAQEGCKVLDTNMAKVESLFASRFWMSASMRRQDDEDEYDGFNPNGTD